MGETDWEGLGKEEGARRGPHSRELGTARPWCRVPRSRIPARGARCAVHRAPREKLGPGAHSAPCTAYHHSGPELDAWPKKEGARRELG